MIDVDQVPDFIWVELAESFYREARKFYQDPKNREAFKKWQAEREASKNGS